MVPKVQKIAHSGHTGYRKMIGKINFHSREGLGTLKLEPLVWEDFIWVGHSLRSKVPTPNSCSNSSYDTVAQKQTSLKQQQGRVTEPSSKARLVEKVRYVM